MHNSAPTSAGCGLSWPECYFRAEENSTHLETLRGQCRRLQLDGNVAEGERRYSCRTGKQCSTNIPVTQTQNQRNSSSILWICPPPSAPALRKEQPAEAVHPVVLPGAPSRAPRCRGCRQSRHVAGVLCRPGPFPLAVWTLSACQPRLRNGKVDPISYLCLLWQASSVGPCLTWSLTEFSSLQPGTPRCLVSFFCPGLWTTVFTLSCV